MLIAHGVTHPGTVRPHNEDAVLCAPDIGLFVVADGMGGVNAGEVASRMAVEAIQLFISRSGPDFTHTWPFGIDAELSYQGNRLRTAVKLANRSVFRASEQQSQYTGMGTTVAAVLADGRTATCGAIGDSRIYVVSRGGIRQLSEDHTWVETLRAQNPSLDPAALARHPMRHVLTRVVGGQADVDVPVTEHTIADGERLLLCSDGVHRGLTDEDLHALTRQGTVAEAAAAIVAAALTADGRDNISALVLGADQP
jgi:protein phosphatase